MNTQIIVYRKSISIESKVAYIRVEQTPSKVLWCFNLQPIKLSSDMRPSSYLFILLTGYCLCSGVYNPEPVICAIQHQFVLKHFKVITVVLTFVLTMYIQHLNNTRQIEELITRCEVLDTKIKDQYERIDAIKLDKAVFEATITQFASIQNDLHEIREDLRALLEHNAVCGK